MTPRKNYTPSTRLKQALERTKKVYPEQKSFSTPGAIGNHRQWSKYMEWK